jgi:uncharacterized membrane protein
VGRNSPGRHPERHEEHFAQSDVNLRPPSARMEIDKMTARNVPGILYPKLPMHSAFRHFAMAFFLGTLVTDLSYWKTAEMTWANFSAWLLAAGLLMGGIAVLVSLLDWVLGRLTGPQRFTWPYLIGNLVVLALSFLNALVHSRDAWTSVVPLGVAISAGVVLLMLLSSFFGRAKAHAYVRGEAL